MLERCPIPTGQPGSDERRQHVQLPANPRGHLPFLAQVPDRQTLGGHRTVELRTAVVVVVVKWAVLSELTVGGVHDFVPIRRGNHADPVGVAGPGTVATNDEVTAFATA